MYYSGLLWNGGIGKEQLVWLKHQLDDAKNKKQRVIINCHFPLYPKGSYILWNAKEVIDLIERYPNVVAYFNGHVHRAYYTLQSSIHQVTFAGMVEKGENSFAIVSVFNDRLEIKGYGKENDRILPFRSEPPRQTN